MVLASMIRWLEAGRTASAAAFDIAGTDYMQRSKIGRAKIPAV